MPFNPGEAQIRFVFRLASDPQDMIVTCGAAIDLTPSAVEVQQIYDTYQDNWLPALSNQYTYRGVVVQGKSTGGTEYSVELFSNATGTGVFAPLTQNSAILVQKRTGLSGRRNRGRMYLPGVCDEGLVASNGTIDPAQLGSLQTLATEWYNDLVACAAISNVLILHYDPVTHLPDGPGTVVSAFVVDDVIATQRTRMR